MSKHPKGTRITDSARGGMDKTMAKEIRPACDDCSRPATVRRVDEDGKWIDLCANHDRAIDVANNDWMDEAR